jgi:hypothetical protein
MNKATLNSVAQAEHAENFILKARIDDVLRKLQEVKDELASTERMLVGAEALVKHYRSRTIPGLLRRAWKLVRRA